MSDIEAQEPLSNISDSSFVILGQGSIPPVNAQDNPKENPTSDSLINSKSSFSVFESTSTSINEKGQNKSLLDGSLYEEDAQKKLDEIVKENSQLKETLAQNNLAIKSQLDTFFMWQQEVLKTHEVHKQKFLETKDLILKLRAENINLKKQLEELVVRDSIVNGDVQGDKKPGEDLTELKERMKEFEEICNSLTGKNENLVKENEKLREDLKAENREIINLNRKLQDFESEVEFLKQSIESSKKSSLESVLHKSLPNTETQVKITDFIVELEGAKGNASELSKEPEKPKSEVRSSLTKELNGCIDNLDDINTSLDMQSQKFGSFHSWVALAEENLKESKFSERLDSNLSEINKLQGQRDQKEYTSVEDKDLQELRSQFNKLLLDYQGLQEQLNKNQKNEPNFEDYAVQMSTLSYELEAKARELKSKEEECEKLKEVIKSLQADCEETAALRIQVQLHKADFIDERKQRDLLIAENEQLAEKIEFLESTIIVLEQEKEASKRKDNTLCPRCVQSFPNLATFQTHLEECCNADYFH